jgi:Glycosyl hydrolase family 3 N terminal domain
MAAYNSVNGATMTEHPMLREVLKDEWGFDGVVMSDWFAARSTEPAANAGLDLVMPGPGGPLGRQAGRRRPCRSGRRGDRRRQGHAAAAAGRRVGGLDGVEPAAPTAEPWPEAARGPGVRVDHGRGGRSTDRLPVAPATLLRHPETAGPAWRFGSWPPTAGCWGARRPCGRRCRRRPTGHRPGPGRASSPPALVGHRPRLARRARHLRVTAGPSVTDQPLAGDVEATQQPPAGLPPSPAEGASPAQAPPARGRRRAT